MLLPTVSVIIPSRNRPAFLREAILSAINQTLPPLEILVVDNGSDPDIREVILRLAALHACVRFIALNRNYGAGHARNMGLQPLRGIGFSFSTMMTSCLRTFWSAASRPSPARTAPRWPWAAL